MRPALFATSILAAMWAASSPTPLYAAPLFTTAPYAVDSTNAPSNDATIVPHLPLSGQSLFTPLTNGDATLTASQIPVNANTAWLTFDYNTVGGIPIGIQGANWAINETGIAAAQPLNFIARFISFDHLGTNLPPINCAIFGMNFHVGTDPSGAIGGVGCLAVGFSQSFPAGPMPAFGTFIGPFNSLNNTGIDSTQVTSYFQALEFTAQPSTGVPEPASFAIFGIGVTALASLLLAHSRRTP
jgi:hypothetical protein